MATKWSPKMQGDKAFDWVLNIGSSQLNTIPVIQLPRLKTVLQWYNAFRIETPFASKASLNQQITKITKLTYYGHLPLHPSRAYRCSKARDAGERSLP